MKKRSRPGKTPDYILDDLSLNGMLIPVISPDLSARDIMGSVMVRMGFGRKRYRVQPGLYAAGHPDASSPVLVTANYKLTFDALRRELKNIDAFLLVLDTRGINVWCAAGKGTFGTMELVRQIIGVRLESVVSHRKVICPQLGAVGVSAHKVRSFTKFNVVYGPVLAADIPAFLNNGMIKTPEMRRVRFSLPDRAILVPVEVVRSWPFFAGSLFLSVTAAWISGRLSSPGWIMEILRDAAPVLGAIVAGSALVPLFLPILPFRAFSLKGLTAGILWFCVTLLLFPLTFWPALASFLLVTPVTAFLAMNFTGSSTYTGLSGAELEVRTGTPLMIAAALSGAALKTLAALKILS